MQTRFLTSELIDLYTLLPNQTGAYEVRPDLDGIPQAIPDSLVRTLVLVHYPASAVRVYHLLGSIKATKSDNLPRPRRLLCEVDPPVYQ